MSVTFVTRVDQEQTIRPPAGVVLPQGKLRVHVEALEETTTSTVKKSGRYQWMKELARQADALEVDLPSDMAANHDYYASGKPKP